MDQLTPAEVFIEAFFDRWEDYPPDEVRKGWERGLLAAFEKAAPALRSQERQRVREALDEQAAEYRREANEARQCGAQGGWEKLTAAGDVVECVTRIIFDSDPEQPPLSEGQKGDPYEWGPGDQRDIDRAEQLIAEGKIPPCEISEGVGSGADLIAAERKRQIEAEGWTPEHDDQHDDGELARAAAAYALVAGAGPTKQADEAEQWWPFDDDWKPSEDEIRNLAKAGALIAAEIDRLQRRYPVPPPQAVQGEAEARPRPTAKEVRDSLNDIEAAVQDCWEAVHEDPGCVDADRAMTPFEDLHAQARRLFVALGFERPEKGGEG